MKTTSAQRKGDTIDEELIFAAPGAASAMHWGGKTTAATRHRDGLRDAVPNEANNAAQAKTDFSIGELRIRAQIRFQRNSGPSGGLSI